MENNNAKQSSNTQPERIEALQKKLYEKSAPSVQRSVRHGLSKDESEAPTNWQHEDDVNFAMGRVDTQKSFATKFLIGTLVFFVLALGITSVFFFGGMNVISSENVAIDITAPATIEGGEEVSFDVEIKNENNVGLKSVLVMIEYPDGTRSSENTSISLLRVRETIGDIAVSESGTRTFKAVLFGAEGQEQEVKVSIEYRVEGSNAIFSKEKTYPILISGAPVRLTVETSEEVTTGEQFTTVVTVTSNATETIEDVLLVGEFPFGYSMQDGTPDPDFGNNVWSLGDLPAGSSRTIRVAGSISGQEGEERVLRFTAGIQPDRDRRTIDTPLITAIAPVIVTQPFIGTSLSVNGSSADTVAVNPNSNAGVSVQWANNLATSLTDAVIEVAVSGNGFDPRTIQPNGGFYDSARGLIVWDGRTDTRLNRLRPGDSGTVTFVVGTTGYEAGGNELSNPVINLKASVRGVRDDGDVDTVTSSASQTIKVATRAEAFTTVSHGTVLTDNGPIPPRVAQETTYTITWEIKNTTNDITNAKMSARLPEFVSYANVAFPNTETVRYDSSTKTITWDAGTVLRGAGVFGDSRKVSFQVILNPSLGQLGKQPIILEATSFSARDSHTETTSGSTIGPVSTRLPGYNADKANVVE